MKTLSFKFCILGLVAFAAPAAADDSVYVKVRSTKLRNAPQHWANAKSVLSYGDRLTGIGAKEGWIEVKTTAGTQGYVHQSALTEREVIVKPAQAEEAAELKESEVVIAGKGFNRQVEQQYASGESLNFAAVNKMERRAIPDSEVASFIRAGQLKTEG